MPRGGLDRASEEDGRRLCGAVFAPELGANGLLSNRSQWFGASIVRNERWSHGNVVLLGDACRSVHFSLGSGTRMVMQDAIALSPRSAATGATTCAARAGWRMVTLRERDPRFIAACRAGLRTAA